MRLVQFVEDLRAGGLERMAVDLAIALHAAGHQTSVYTLFGAGPLRGDLERHGVPIVEFHKERLTRPRLLWSIATQLRRDRIQVVHGHNPGVHHFAAAAKRLAGVPACVNTRHSVVMSNGVPYQERYFRLVEPLTNHVVFDCEHVKAGLAPRLRYPGRKYSVILNAIPLEPFLARSASPGSRAPHLRFGAVGRLVPAKGHSVLIEAFAKIAARLPHATVHIFGGGAQEPALRRQIAELGLNGRVILEGHVEEPMTAFEQLDVFVLPSLNEGLPLVVLEAMAAGLPVVSTRVGGVLEVAPERLFPWFCEPGDVNGLADALLRAAASEMARIGREARTLAMSRYGIADMRGRYEALYEKTVAEATR